MSRKGPLTRYFSWWRGQDLNLRPSGYEPDSRAPAWSRSVPSRTSELGFRAFDVPVRTTADQPIPARGVEASVEEGGGGVTADQPHDFQRLLQLDRGSVVDSSLEKIDKVTNGKVGRSDEILEGHLRLDGRTPHGPFQE